VTDFAIRGVIEGFYGKPWAHEDRLWLLERMGRWGMNSYMYAPKDDPLHLARWREPYPEAQLAEFRALVAAGERSGVAVGFAVSPGRSIVYSDRQERAALVAKLGAFHALGARVLALGVDDVPSNLLHEADRRAFRSLADAQLLLLREVHDAFGRDTQLWLSPTDYLGVEPTDYLEELGERLDPAIEVAWTGRTVLAPDISAHEAAARAKTLRRRVLLADNTPVADGPMRCMLHLNPYTGRDRALAAHVSGILLNPMEQARASAITLRCAAEYMADPRGYDAERAWARAVDELGEAVAPALRLFAQAHRFSPSTSDDRDRALETGTPRSARVLGIVGFEGKLTREPIPNKTSYGPRRVLYPQLVSMRDETMGFGADPSLYTDRCLSDALIRYVERRALELLGADSAPRSSRA